MQDLMREKVSCTNRWVAVWLVGDGASSPVSRELLSTQIRKVWTAATAVRHARSDLSWTQSPYG